MAYSYSIISKEEFEIIGLATAKANLDVTFDDDDAMIGDYIQSALEWVETYTGRFFVPTVVEVYLDGLSKLQELPHAPAQSFASLLVNGETITPRVIGGDHMKLLPPLGESWPYFEKELGAVVIRYTAGYPEGQAPKVMISAALLVVSIYYDKPVGRELESQWKAVRDLLTQLRVRTL